MAICAVRKIARNGWCRRLRTIRPDGWTSMVSDVQNLVVDRYHFGGYGDSRNKINRD